MTVVKKKSGKKSPAKSQKGAQGKPGTEKKQAAHPAPAKSPAKNNKNNEIKKEPGTGKHPGGAPTKYDAGSHPLMGWVLAVMGGTNIQIAAGLHISTRTLHDWGKKHPEFLSSIKEGKAITNAKVVKALLSRALGTRYPETKVIQNPDGTTRKEVTMREVLPDVAAIKLWLTNRDPNNWKDRLALGADPNAPPLESTIIVIPDNGRDKTTPIPAAESH